MLYIKYSVSLFYFFIKNKILITNNFTELPYAYHHEVINNSSSVVREPLKTNKTNQKKQWVPTNKQKTSVKRSPRIVKGLPSKSISNACNRCPNKVFYFLLVLK